MIGVSLLCRWSYAVITNELAHTHNRFTVTRIDIFLNNKQINTNTQTLYTKFSIYLLSILKSNKAEFILELSDEICKFCNIECHVKLVMNPVIL